MSTEIVKSTFDAIQKVTAERAREFAILLQPYGMQADRFRMVLLEELRRTPALLVCERTSILRAAYYAAEIGLELGGPLGDAYLVPFWNKRTKRKEAKCIPGYRGLIHVAQEADPLIDHFDAEIAHEGDVFRETRGTSPALLHEPNRASGGEPVAAYAVVHKRSSDAPPQFTVVPWHGTDAEPGVLEIKAAALSKLEDWQKRDSPWTKHEGEMGKKTAVRRLVKLMNLRTTRARLTLDLDAKEHQEPAREMKTRAEDLKDKLGHVPAEVVEGEFDDVDEQGGDDANG